jgi:EmrB/QacA subfamily drug resistance transporter
MMATATAPTRTGPNRWAVLAMVAVAQLMVILDMTIVNVALPSAQEDLGFSDGTRQWIVTAYALAFGSLLLVGGKLGDLFGRKWTFIAGLSGFAIASALGGLAESFGVLVAARALQGVFAALLAPSTLSLLSVTFADSPDRPKAFGLFSATSTGGVTVGLLLGGLLTDALSWRWCLWVNLVVAVPTALAALRLLVNERHPDRPRIDVPGVLTASAGLFALVYGFSNAETDAWSAPLTIISLIASATLLAAFVLVERRVVAPLLPLHIVRDRMRGGGYVAIALAGAAGFGMLLFLTFYLQQNLDYSPMKTGVAFLPMSSVTMFTAVIVQTRMLGRFGAQRIVVLGMAISMVAMISFTQLTPDSSYLTHVLPGLVGAGLGMPCVMAPVIGTATLGVAATDAGVASAMVSTSQQVGGSVGTALLSTLAAGAAASYAAGHAGADVTQAAAVHGYATAFWWSAGLFGVGLFVALLMLPSGTGPRARQPAPVLAMEME